MSVVPTCTSCGQVISPDDINVARDVAYCRRCNVASSLSALTGSAAGQDEDDLSGVDLLHPPAGCSCDYDGLGTTITASHRNLLAASGLVFAALFWNGITSVFVLVALSGTIANLGWALPEWFPAPEMNGAPMSVGMNLFLWVFLTPFIVIGLGMIGAVLLMISGQTRIRVEPHEVSVHTGVGGMGWTRRFDAQAVSQVTTEYTSTEVNGRPLQAIVVKCRDGKRVRFGSMMSEERRSYIVAALRDTLRRVGSRRPVPRVRL